MKFFGPKQMVLKRFGREPRMWFLIFPLFGWAPKITRQKLLTDSLEMVPVIRWLEWAQWTKRDGTRFWYDLELTGESDE